jgi:DMSO/TMAO reductase YedYZ heme-binding membrane subunit
MNQNPQTPPIKTIVLTLVGAAALVVTFWLSANALLDAMQAPMPKWILARSSGIVSYLLLWVTTIFGILVSHPHSPRWNWMQLVTRLRLHVGFSVFAIAFTLLHIIVLATDDYAKVGWAGAFLPFASEYRPVPVTLGVIAFWGMVISALTAALSNTRFFGRSWIWIHRISIVFYIAAWVHGMLSGADTSSLLWLYLATGMFALIFALWRYATPSIKTRRHEFAAGSRPRVREEGS